MIKVLHCELSYTSGGIENFLLNFTSQVNKEEFQFDFLTHWEKIATEYRFVEMGCNVYKAPKALFKYIKYVKKLLIEKKYDIIHIHKNSAANIVLPILAMKYSNAKIIVHSHNTKPNQDKFLTRLLHKINRRKLIKIADKKYACSELAANWLFGSCDNVTIINNGILVDKFKFNQEKRLSMREKYGIGFDSFVIGHVGGFREQKNHSFLVNVFYEYIKFNPNSYLMLIGGGRLKNQIVEQVKGLGISNKVIFVGVVDNTFDYYQAMDVIVMPSLWEGLPVSTIEAQTNGLKVLISDTSSRMCNITGLVDFISLDSVENWINKLRLLKTNDCRISPVDKIILNGFDVKTTTDRILNDYLTLVKE